MAEGKTITIVQKGKSTPVEEEITVRVAVSNLASPATITGASASQISYMELDIRVNNASIPINWNTQFGPMQAASIKCKKGSNISIVYSRPHYIPGQNLEMVSGYLCQYGSQIGEFTSPQTLYYNVKENLNLFYVIKKELCIG